MKEGKASRTLFLHEALFPTHCGPEDLTDKINFPISIDLMDQSLVLKDLRLLHQGNTFLIFYGPGMKVDPWVHSQPNMAILGVGQ